MDWGESSQPASRPDDDNYIYHMFRSQSHCRGISGHTTLRLPLIVRRWSNYSAFPPPPPAPHYPRHCRPLLFHVPLFHAIFMLFVWSVELWNHHQHSASKSVVGAPLERSGRRREAPTQSSHHPARAPEHPLLLLCHTSTFSAQLDDDSFITFCITLLLPLRVPIRTHSWAVASSLFRHLRRGGYTGADSQQGPIHM